ncbi:MAG: nuclear transport factor 2 family protein [Betaproteobacteria bacterium]
MNSPQDLEFLKTFSENWLKAWNSHRTDAILDLVHDDIEWKDQTFWDKVIHGKVDLRQYIDKIWTVMHDVRFEDIQSFVAPDRLRALVLFRQTGNPPRNTTGWKPFDTHGCDIFLEFKDSRLSQYLASYDIVNMMCQMGALPERKNKFGGAYLLSLANPRS